MTSDDKTMVTATLPTTDVLDRIDRLAKIAAASGLTTYRKTESAAMVLLTGRELGLGPMASLRGIHDVSGKPVLAADLMVAVIRRSGLCQKWRVVESTVSRCEIVTRRVGEEDDESCVWTAEDAKRAGCGGPTWQKFPRQMLSHRCASELARRVYSDVLLGLYTPDELGGDEAPSDAAPEVVDATAARVDVITIPRDNGPSPSEAAASRSVEVDHYDAASRLIDGASTLPELAAAWGVIARDHIPHLGPNERTAIVAAKDARKASLPAAPPPSDDPPPDGPTKPRRGPRKATQGDAAADATAAPQGASTGAQEGPAAWLATEADTAEHARGLTTGHAVEASARKHNAALAATPWGVRVYAERLAALEGASVDQCARYVVAWCKHGPKAAATAQRRAA